MADNDNARKDQGPETAPETDAEAREARDSGAAESAEGAAGAPEGADGDDALARAEALAQEYRDQLLRTRAEAENQRKRMERENTNAVKYAAEKVFRDLLAVADSLDLGLKAARDADAASAVVEGIELTHKQLQDTLARHGVSVLDPAGSTFDPEYHEAVSMVPSPDVAPNHVLEVVQRGYCLHERVLRPARVVVASAPPGQAGDEAG